MREGVKFIRAKKNGVMQNFIGSKYFLNFSQVSKPTDFCTSAMFQTHTKTWLCFACNSNKTNCFFQKCHSLILSFINFVKLINYKMSFSNIFVCDSESLKSKYMFATGFFVRDVFWPLLLSVNLYNDLLLYFFFFFYMFSDGCCRSQEKEYRRSFVMVPAVSPFSS